VLIVVLRLGWILGLLVGELGLLAPVRLLTRSLRLLCLALLLPLGRLRRLRSGGGRSTAIRSRRPKIEGTSSLLVALRVPLGARDPLLGRDFGLLVGIQAVRADPVCLALRGHPVQREVVALEVDLHRRVQIEAVRQALALLWEAAERICGKGSRPCLLQGYPSQRVKLPTSTDQRPFIESDGLFTLSIAPARRRRPRLPGVDVAVEYPPHDRSIDDVLTPPPGVSGGGIWLVPRFDEGLIWSAENSKLFALARSWSKDEREELATRIQCWLSLVGEQIAELHDETDAILLKLAGR